MTMIDSLRTLMGIRKHRQILPAGRQPPLGSSIVNERIRIRLIYPISHEQWIWFTKLGWRTVNMRENRRRYVNVSDKVFHRMISAETEAEREMIHQSIFDLANKKSSAAREARAAKTTEESKN